MRNAPYPYYELPQISGIADMLEQKATSIPENVAFIYRKGKENLVKVTYKQLLEDTRRLACYIENNYGRGNHIALIGENSYEWLSAFLGVITSGNTAVPIDKELPANEVEDLIRMADVTSAFVSKTYMDLVENIESLKSMSLKKLSDAQTEGWETYELNKPADEELAEIIFTSGTSGKSKGVMLSHGNITAEINTTCQLFHPEGTRTMSILPLHHAFGLNTAVLMALNYNTSIFINKSLKTLLKDVQEAKPDIIMLVPLFIETFYKQVMDNARKTGQEKKLARAEKLSNMLLKIGIDKRRSFFSQIIGVFGGNLKYIISGGAHIDPFYVKKFRSFGITVLNGYGATECAPCFAVNRNYYYRDGSVGQLCPGMEAKISEESEVMVKGPVVMQGYYKNPEATEDVLKDGWYRTGDLGYIDKDGFIFLTGRAKNLIILSNGENISPEEIENDFMLDRAVGEILVYESGNKIVAEIYPIEEFMGNQEYFDKLMLKVNTGRPAYKQVASVKLREEEFIKNTSKKIIRYKNLPQK